MATDPEALTQLARLLGVAPARLEEPAQRHELVDQGFEALAGAVLAETASSDDVFDRASALAFVSGRLDQLTSLLTPDQQERLRRTLRAKIEAW